MVDGYNPLSEELRAEPSVAYRHLLEEAPVHFFEAFEPPFYTLSRFADVQSALLDIETYSSEFGQGPRFSPPAGMLSNPPQHTFYRSLVQQAFTPRAIAEWADRITEISEELLDERVDAGNWDMHDDYAFPLPVIVIVEMLGVPGDDLQRFKYWSDITVEAMGADLDMKGLLLSGGDDWRHQRRIVVKALGTGRLKPFFPALAVSVGRLRRRWDRAADTCQPVDLCDDLMRLTVDVITSFARCFTDTTGSTRGKSRRSAIWPRTDQP